jgi:ADP-heptose:LPS heptosyltransferase
MSNVLPTLDRILKKAIKLILLALDQLLMLSRRPGTAGGVALIRLDRIGDFILWLDTARVYRQLYPNHKITLVASTHWVELADVLPYWDEIITVDTQLLCQNWLYRWKTLSRLRAHGFETAIQPVYSREIMTGDSLIRATGSCYRIGFQSSYKNILPWQTRISDRWYTQLIAVDNDSQMELEQNAGFVEKLSGNLHAASMPVIPSLIKLSERLMIGQPYCVIFPGASWWGKRWSAERFVLTAQNISQEQNWHIVIAGGPDDQAACSKVAKLIGDAAIDLSGQTSLLELIELIRHSQLLISNDTSAIHIAAAVGTPSLCILGGGHFGRFMPYSTGSIHTPVSVYDPMPCYGCNWKCTQPHNAGEAVPCIQAVSVEMVGDAVRQLCGSLPS